MRKPGADAAQITPTPGGWRLHLGAGPARTATSLAELAQEIPLGTRVEVALPISAVLLDRMTLPSTDREELMGMIQLHLEKTLPYAVEEVTSGYEVIQQTENETTLVAVAVHGPVLEGLCAPLRSGERLPAHVTLFALDLAAQIQSGSCVAAVWNEQAHLAIAIFEGGKLSWAYSLVEASGATLASDLPPLLLTAEMEGVSTNVQSVALASDCEELRGPLHDIFGVPIALFAIEEVRPRAALNLLPPDWASAAHAVERRDRLQQRLMLAAMIYLLLVACAFLYLAWTKRQLQVIESEIARTQPLLVATQQQQARLRAMAPALERSHYAVEQLFLVHRNVPPQVKITRFDCAPEQFTVQGEAPNAGLAIDFAERLRKEKELSAYQIESGPPKILSNNHAQFSIFGKL